jgi:hypothetical protein
VGSGLAGVTNDVLGVGKDEAGVTQQLAVGRLGDCGDQEAGRDPTRHLVGVVGPQHRVRISVHHPHGIAETRRLGGGEHPYTDVAEPHGIGGRGVACRRHGVIVRVAHRVSFELT